jgi:hypothetical protein
VRLTERSVDRIGLVGGLALAGLGVVLLLDQIDAIELSFGWFGAALAAAIGVALLASGLDQPRD